MLVDKVDELVLGRILDLIDVLSLSESVEFLVEEVVKVDVDSPSHSFFLHPLTINF
jgi:hypothetical protein